MTKEEIEERAREMAALKLTGQVPMTDAERAAWCEGWREGLDHGNRLPKAKIDALRTTQKDGRS